MPVTGTLFLDISDEGDWGDDRRRLEPLQRTPDGAHVVIDVGARWTVSVDGAEWIHPHADRLDVEIVGTSPDAVRHWCSAARLGQHWMELVGV